MSPVLNQGLSWVARVIRAGACNEFAACLSRLLPPLCLRSLILVLGLLSAATGNQCLTTLPKAENHWKHSACTPFAPYFLCVQGAQPSLRMCGVSGEGTCLLVSPPFHPSAFCLGMTPCIGVLRATGHHCRGKETLCRGGNLLVPAGGRACVSAEPSKLGLSKRLIVCGRWSNSVYRMYFIHNV